MNAKELFTEVRLLIRDFGVLLSAMPVEAGEFETEEVEADDKPKMGWPTKENKRPSPSDKGELIQKDNEEINNV